MISLLSFDFKNSNSVSFGPSSERVIEKHCAGTKSGSSITKDDGGQKKLKSSDPRQEDVSPKQRYKGIYQK